MCEFNSEVVKNQMTVTSGLPDAGWSVNHITVGSAVIGICEMWVSTK